MRTTLEQVKARLGEAGAAPPLRPRPEFVDALESRLLAQAAGDEDPAALPLPSRPAGLVRSRRALLAVAAVGAVLAGLVVAPSGQERPGRVRTVDVGTATTPGPVSPVPEPAPVPDPVIPPTPAPAPSPAVTVVPAAPRPRPPAESRPRSAPVPAPTTSIAPPSTAPEAPVADPGPATRQPPATTSPPPARDGLALRCHARATAGGPRVSCEWSEPNSPQFAGYRLMRKTASGGTVVKVFATRERAVRSYIDTVVQQGERYGYVVEAKDPSGRVIARSGVASVTCCPD